MENRSVDVSIIIPIKDEAESIEPLAQEVFSAMNRHPWNWECIWIDDGSIDQSLVKLKELSARDSHHRYLSFERNAGQSAAFCAGFKAAAGEILATIDGDGQNDPADLPPLIEMIISGRADMVNGYRRKREDVLVRKAASRIANGFRNWVTGRTVRDVGCSTRAFTRKCIEDLPQFAGMHRFFPTLVALKGFRLAEVPVNHRPRTRGSSKYSVNNRLWVGLFDTCGVFWLKKRAFHYRIKSSNDS